MVVHNNFSHVCIRRIRDGGAVLPGSHSRQVVTKAVAAVFKWLHVFECRPPCLPRQRTLLTYTDERTSSYAGGGAVPALTSSVKGAGAALKAEKYEGGGGKTGVGGPTWLSGDLSRTDLRVVVCATQRGPARKERARQPVCSSLFFFSLSLSFP